MTKFKIKAFILQTLVDKIVLTLNVLCRRLHFLFIKMTQLEIVTLVENITISPNLKNDTSTIWSTD